MTEDVSLSQREIEVLKLLTKGLNNKEIGDILHISVHTVKAHVSSILEKMEVESRVKAAVNAVRNHIIEMSDVSEN